MVELSIKAPHDFKSIKVGSRVMMVRFTIHFSDPCRAGPSTPDLWCITVTTQVSFPYLVRF